MTEEAAPPPQATPFRVAEKRFRRRRTRVGRRRGATVWRVEETDLSGVVDTRNMGSLVAAGTATAVPRTGDARAAFRLHAVPGLVILPAALTRAEQLQLARTCVEEYPQPPHVTNLDALCGQPVSNVWRRAVDAPDAVVEEKVSGKVITATKLLDKLRWVTLGRHYDWTSRTYTAHTCAFPAPLAKLARDVARDAGEEGYIPEAGIVNFYTPSSTLGGHKDDAETTMARPIVSVSLGLSAVFLIAREKTDAPTALLLHSGDCVVMAGEAREFVHGVPRVFADSWKAGDAADPVQAYMGTHRINVNVRQVAEVDG